MKYAHYDVNGLILGYYDEDIHETIPTSNLQLTDEEWQDCIDHPGERKVSNGKIVTYTPTPDLAQTKKVKLAELQSKAETAIKNGFESSALGSKNKYDSEQHNVDWIQAAVLSGSAAKITCDDLKGAATSKQPRDHTEAQCKQVLKDGMSALLTRKTKFRTLRAQVTAATTVAAVEAITW